MITHEEAIAILDNSLSAWKPAREKVASRDAGARWLLEDAVSLIDQPPFDRSAVDGYALIQGDHSESFRMVEVVAAGRTPSRRLEPGTTIKVMTGAPVPEGTGRVVMVEEAVDKDGKVLLRDAGGSSNIQKQAEDVRQGDVVITAGQRLSAADIGILISCGIMEVAVSRPIRVSIVSTGSEIVDDPSMLGHARIMDSNRPMMAALSRESGLEVVRESQAPDDRKTIADEIRLGLDASDLILVSGGVSVGDFDFAAEAMQDAGLEVRFSRVAQKPGKPLTFAFAQGKVAFGLPGNPVAVFLMFHLFVRRAQAWMSGGRPDSGVIAARLGRPFTRKKADRTQFVPCRLTEGGLVEAIAYHGSAHLAALASTRGFFKVSKGVKTIEEGQEVVFVPIRRLCA